MRAMSSWFYLLLTHVAQDESLFRSHHIYKKIRKDFRAQNNLRVQMLCHLKSYRIFFKEFCDDTFFTFLFGLLFFLLLNFVCMRLPLSYLVLVFLFIPPVPYSSNYASRKASPSNTSLIRMFVFFLLLWSGWERLLWLFFKLRLYNIG